MHAEPAAQLRLLDLAGLDQETGCLQHQARSLPHHQQVTDLMQQRTTATDALTMANTDLDTAQVALQRAESDLTPVRQRLEREQKRIDDGSVTDPKVLRGLTAEVDHIRRRISTLEDVQLEAMGSLEEAQTAVQEATRRKDEVESELRDVVTARDSEVATLAASAQEVAAKRRQVAAELPAELLALYEKIRANTGLGAAALSRGRCQGCQLELTLADLDSYRKAPRDQVLRCAECNRILVRTPESGL